MSINAPNFNPVTPEVITPRQEVIAPRRVVIDPGQDAPSPENTEQSLRQAFEEQEAVRPPLQPPEKTTDEADKVVDSLNSYMDELQTNLGFSVREGSDKQVVITITNRESNEVIRQIPSEEVLVLRDKMAELTGILFDKKV